MRWLNLWWVRSLLCMALAWVGVLVAVLIWSGCGHPWAVEPGMELRVCDLPNERVLQVPPGAWYTPAPCKDSSVPIVQLREYAPGEFELLYWGNPVRPRYMYRVLNIMSGNSVLLSPEGEPESQRNLPVPSPRRADGKLPLQPAQKLGRLCPAPGGFCAVRVEVLAPEKDIVLCWAEFLLPCPEHH